MRSGEPFRRVGRRRSAPARTCAMLSAAQMKNERGPDDMSDATPKVLVVEDEAEIRRFVRMALEQQGYDVSEADGVKRGLIEAGTRRPDMVILDLGLPDGDGVDLLRDLRTWSENTPSSAMAK